MCPAVPTVSAISGRASALEPGRDTVPQERSVVDDIDEAPARMRRTARHRAPRTVWTPAGRPAASAAARTRAIASTSTGSSRARRHRQPERDREIPWTHVERGDARDTGDAPRPARPPRGTRSGRSPRPPRAHRHRASWPLETARNRACRGARTTQRATARTASSAESTFGITTPWAPRSSARPIATGSFATTRTSGAAPRASIAGKAAGDRLRTPGRAAGR